MPKPANGSTGLDICREVELSLDHLTAHLESVATSDPNWTPEQWQAQAKQWRQTAKILRHSTRRIEYLIRHCTLGVVVARRHTD